jgi:preprotein translocase subunit SecG
MQTILNILPYIQIGLAVVLTLLVLIQQSEALSVRLSAGTLSARSTGQEEEQSL